MKVVYSPTGKAGEYAALACNLYRGCDCGCAYCYAPAICRRGRGDYHAHCEPRDGILEDLESDAARLSRAQTVTLLKPPILLCFLSDPYPVNPACDGITRKALQILKDYDLHWSILTKRPTRALADLDLYRPGDSLGVTLTLDNPLDSEDWEPHAEPPTVRIQALATAHERGIRTWVSLEPVIWPSQTINLIEQSWPVVDEYRLGKLNYHEHGKLIDWKYALPKLDAALKKAGRPYTIKLDSRKYLEAQ